MADGHDEKKYAHPTCSDEKYYTCGKAYRKQAVPMGMGREQVV